MSGPRHQQLTRLASLQQLRGVAVLLVVVLHAINVVDFRVERGTDSDPGFISTWLSFNEFGACGVDLFFVISGFVMAMLLKADHRPNRADFLYMRFMRIAPLFWLAALAYTLLSLAVGRTIPFGEMVTNFTVLPISLFRFDPPVLVVGWSLSFELAFYLLVALMLPSKRPAVSLALLLLLLISLSIIWPPPSGIFSVFANPIQFEFLGGIAAHALWRKLKSRPISSAAGTVLIGLACGFMALQIFTGLPFNANHMMIISGETSLLRALLWGLPAGFIVLGCVLLDSGQAARRAIGGRFLRLTGDASYSLYLTHLSLCMLADVLLPPDAVSPDFLIISLTAASWLLGVSVYHSVEAPMLIALRRYRPGSVGWSAPLKPPFRQAP